MPAVRLRLGRPLAPAGVSRVRPIEMDVGIPDRDLAADQLVEDDTERWPRPPSVTTTGKGRDMRV